jgi:hypothetical protein
MVAMLEAADAAKAEMVKSGIPARVALENLRAGVAGRTREMARLANDFKLYFNCLIGYRQAIAYLIELNQMPHFPDPIVDPVGEIGGFIGAYMRKHVIVDHDAIVQGILIAALNAHTAIQPSARQSPTRAASLALIEKAVEKLDPIMAAEVRQNRGKMALKNFLDNRAELKKRQEKAIQDYKSSYKGLAKDNQEALLALSPPPSTERSTAHEHARPIQSPR